MKKILFALLIALLSVGQLWAGHDKHYGKTTVGITTSSSGNGSVYASTSNVDISSISGWHTTDNAYTYNCNKDGTKDTMTYYCYAKANDGKHFLGWTTSKTGTTIYSKDNPMRSSKTISSTNEKSPTSTTWYAVFKNSGDIYYAKQTVKAKEKDSNLNSNGYGKVFLNDVYSSVGTWGNEFTVDNIDADNTVPFYAYAQATEGEFYAWYDENGKFKSYSNPYTISVTSSSKDSSSPTQGATLYAYFRTTVDTKYAKAIVNVQTTQNSSGNGLVFASVDNLKWEEINNENLTKFAVPCTSMVKTIQDSKYGVAIPFYAYAIPKRGFKLQSWSTTATGTAPNLAGWRASDVANPVTYNVTATSTNQSKPTEGKACHAMFIANSSTCNISYKKPSNGNFTVQCLDVVNNTITHVDMLNTDTITAAQSISHYTSDITVLTAQSANGYKVYRWVSYDGNGNVASILAYGQNEYVFTTTSAQTIGVEFIQADANFKIKESGQLCTTLQDAIDKATAYVASNSSATIVPLMDYTVPDGGYTIPAKVTLLIPFDDANTCYTTEPVILHGWRKEDDSGKASSVTDPSTDQSFVYRTLTLAQGAQLNVEGTLSLSAKRWCVITSGCTGADGTPPCGRAASSGSNRVHKGFGLINMESGSSIQVKSGGKLYCWGRIRGEGEITAKSGSEVRESYVYTDWRNNDYFATYTKKTRCFPQNQYYIQDIQVPITYESGSKCLLEGALFYSSGTAAQKGTMGFVGTAGSNSFIELPDGATMTKKYVASEDRLYIDMNKGASFNNFELNYSSWKVATKTHIFTITNNWKVNVNSGTTTINYDLGWAPGSILNIKQGAAVTMLEGVSMYLYDHSDWGDFAAGYRIIPIMKPSQEASYGVNVRTRSYGADCPDAEIIVNGTLTVTGGENKVFKSNDSNCDFDASNKGTYQSGLYTTEGGANIHGTGSIRYVRGDGDQTQTQQLNLTSDWNQNRAFNIVYYTDSYEPRDRFGYGMARPAITSAKLVNKIENDTACYYSTEDAAPRTTFIYNQSKSEWEKLTLTVVPKFTNSKTADSSTKDAIMEGDKISENAPSITGYSIQGVYSDPECTVVIPDAMTSNHLTAYVLYAPNTNTAYTVKHFKQNLDGTYKAAADDTDNLVGTTDAQVTPDTKDYTGFTAPFTQTVLVNADGSRVVEYQYTRNSYTITGTAQGGDKPVTDGGVSVTGGGSYKYEQHVTLTASVTDNERYEWYQWSDGEETMSREIVVGAEDKEYVAIFTKKVVIYDVDVKTDKTIITEEGEDPVEDKSTPSVLTIPENTQASVSNDLTVQSGTTVAVSDNSSLTAQRLIIKAEEYLDADNYEGGKSGDIDVADNATFDAVEACIDIKLTKANNYSSIADTWHAFCVPFPVDLNAGVTCYQGETPITNSKNEVDYAIMQYQGEVRAQGKYGWIKVHKTGAKTLVPGVFYLLTVNDGTTSVRFTKMAGSGLIADNEVTAHPYAVSGEGEDWDMGWNGVGNPNLFKGNLSGEIANAYILDPVNYTYEPYSFDDLDNLKIAVGTPYFVRNEGTSDQTATIEKVASNSSAPARYLAVQNEGAAIPEQKVYIRKDNTYRDKLYVSAAENATGTLADKGNLVKMQMTSSPYVPQIYAVAYNTKLAGMKAVMYYGDAEIPLGIYAPKADTYTIYTNPSDDVTIYLSQNGSIIANLTDGACQVSLAKGTTNEYSLRLIRNITSVVTSTKDASSDAVKVEKIILNGHLYILRDGKMYNAQGTRF